MLYSTLFADSTLREAWAQARGQAPQRRIRLRIDPAAAELHALPWEMLQEGQVMLSAHADIPLSRYLPIALPWSGAVDERPIRVLVAIANPDDLQARYNLAPLDVDLERESVAFSPDSKTLATGSSDNTIRMWSLVAGSTKDGGTYRPIGEPLIGHQEQIKSVVFSPDGSILASGSDDKTIILWDVATQKPRGPALVGHEDRVNSVAFSPDGKTLASGSSDNTVRLWTVATGQPLATPLTGHDDLVLSVAFSPDGKTVASSSEDDTIILWDISTLLQTHLR